MRKAVFAIIFLVLFIAACNGFSRESAIRQLEPVKVFSAINERTEYTESKFAGDDAKAIADLVASECPQGVGDTFVRATLDADAMTLVLYVTTDNKDVMCSVLKPKTAREPQVKTAQEAPSPDVALTVNNQPITITQVRASLDTLPQNIPRDINTTVAIINRLVNDELLRQEAEKVEVSSDDLATTRANLLIQAKIEESGLDAALSAQNITRVEFDASVERQAKLEKLLRTRLLTDRLNVSETEAREYYLQNTNQFVQTEQAVARFIIIGGETEKERTALAQEIADKIPQTDFCELVRQYSVDETRKENCGVYVIPRGVLDANLEGAAFGTPANQTSFVTSGNQAFFVQTLQVTQTQVVPYTQIAGELQSSLRNTLFQQRLNLYLVALRHDADIVTYLG